MNEIEIIPGIINKICRVCLVKCNKLMYLYKLKRIEDEIIRLSTILTELFNIECADGDGFPSQICLGCVRKLCSAYKLKQKCLKSESILQIAIGRAQNFIEIKELPSEIYDMVNNSDGINNIDDIQLLDIKEELQPLQLDLFQIKEEILEQNDQNKEICIENEYNSPFTEVLDEISEPIEIPVKIINSMDVSVPKLRQYTNKKLKQKQENEVKNVGIQNNVSNTSKQIINVIESEENPINTKPSKVNSIPKVNEMKVLKSEEITILKQSSNTTEIPNVPNDNNQSKISNSKGRKLKNSFKIKTKKKSIDLLKKNKISKDKKCDKPKNSKVIKIRTCSICFEKFVGPTALRNHIKEHRKESSFSCKICGIEYKTIESYKGHMLVHRTTENLTHECKVCHKKYSTSFSLKMHVHSHTGEVRYLCGICGKGMIYKHGLKKHMLTHTGEKPFQCDTCGKNFRFKSNLFLHNRSHTQERPYKCEICPKAFLCLGSLKKHAIIHTDEKPFSCQYCEKSFNRQSTLRVHTKIHTGEKCHECSICGKTFIQAHCLRSHMNTHNNEKTLKK